MDKIDYITRQFYRAEKKRFEHYVVTRIWHLLNDLSIKFVTQQYVTRPEGRALTDMFFPQLKIHIEIDEGHHKKNIEWDKLREVDIINATGHKIYRVDVTKDITSINNEIDVILTELRTAKKQTADFKDWDILAEQNPQTYIEKGFIRVEDDVAFKTLVDAANCFGNNYKGLQKGGAKHPNEPTKVIWFPKLYENEGWNNQISNDETTITEICKLPDLVNQHINKVVNGKIHTRIIFARVKSPLGDIMYRFKGEYKLDTAATNPETGLVWRKIANEVKTYKPKMTKEDILTQIIRLANLHQLAEDLDDAALIELDVEHLIADYCVEKRYAVNGFPFKLTENNIDIEEHYKLYDSSVSEAYKQYINYLALEQEDVAELMWGYTNSFWPKQFDSKTDYLESTKALLTSGAMYDFNL
jgi:very-short-patch-repair endonuclease